MHNPREEANSANNCNCRFQTEMVTEAKLMDCSFNCAALLFRVIVYPNNYIIYSLSYHCQFDKGRYDFSAKYLKCEGQTKSVFSENLSLCCIC